MSNFNKGVPKAEKNLKKGSGKLETAVDRLNFFVDKYLHGNKSSFYKKTGLANGFLDRSGGIRTGNLEKVTLAFPELNTHWVLTGIGEVLNSEPVFEERVISEESLVRPFPVYDLDAFAGETSLVNTTDHEYIIGWVRLPGFPDVVGSLRVKGDSMSPKVRPNDQVFITPAINKDLIDWGSMYVVVFNGPMAPAPKVKYVRRGPDKETVILRSENKKYEDMEVKLESIKLLFPAEAGVVAF